MAVLIYFPTPPSRSFYDYGSPHGIFDAGWKTTCVHPQTLGIILPHKQTGWSGAHALHSRCFVHNETLSTLGSMKRMKIEEKKHKHKKKGKTIDSKYRSNNTDRT